MNLSVRVSETADSAWPRGTNELLLSKIEIHVPLSIGQLRTRSARDPRGSVAQPETQGGRSLSQRPKGVGRSATDPSQSAAALCSGGGGGGDVTDY